MEVEEEDQSKSREKGKECQKEEVVFEGAFIMDLGVGCTAYGNGISLLFRSLLICTTQCGECGGEEAEGTVCRRVSVGASSS